MGSNPVAKNLNRVTKPATHKVKNRYIREKQTFYDNITRSAPPSEGVFGFGDGSEDDDGWTPDREETDERTNSSDK